MGLVLHLRVDDRRILDGMLQVLVGSSKRHRIAFVFHVLLAHQDLPSSLLEEIHLGAAEVELLIIVCIVTFLTFTVLVRIVTQLLIISGLVVLTLILLLDRSILFLWSYIFSDKEVLLFIGHHRLLLVCTALSELVLLLL